MIRDINPQQAHEEISKVEFSLTPDRRYYHISALENRNLTERLGEKDKLAANIAWLETVKQALEFIITEQLLAEGRNHEDAAILAQGCVHARSAPGLAIKDIDVDKTMLELLSRQRDDIRIAPAMAA